MKFETRKKLSLWACYIPFIILTLVLIVGTGRLWYACKEEIWRQEAIDNGITVEAEIVRVHSSDPNTVANRTYSLWYEYTDEAGIRYYGVAKNYVSGYETAEKYKGTKVNIYIDGKGNSIVVGGKTHFELMLTLSIVFTALSAISAGFDIWFIFLKGKKRSDGSDSK